MAQTSVRWRRCPARCRRRAKRPIPRYKPPAEGFWRAENVCACLFSPTWRYNTRNRRVLTASAVISDEINGAACSQLTNKTSTRPGSKNDGSATGCAGGRMASMAKRRRALSWLFHRPYSYRGDEARNIGCRGVRVPGVSPPAAGAFPARPGKARPQPFAAGGGGRTIALSFQLDRRGLRRIHVRVGPQSLDPLSAAALDLEGD